MCVQGNMGERSGINKSGKTCVVHSMGALEKVRIKKKAMRVHSWAKGDFWGNLPFLAYDHGKSFICLSLSFLIGNENSTR